jgi:hypothetical protein
MRLPVARVGHAQHEPIHVKASRRQVRMAAVPGELTRA